MNIIESYDDDQCIINDAWVCNLDLIDLDSNNSRNFGENFQPIITPDDDLSLTRINNGDQSDNLLFNNVLMTGNPDLSFGYSNTASTTWLTVSQNFSSSVPIPAADTLFYSTPTSAVTWPMQNFPSVPPSADTLFSYSTPTATETCLMQNFSSHVPPADFSTSFGYSRPTAAAATRPTQISNAVLPSAETSVREEKKMRTSRNLRERVRYTKVKNAMDKLKCKICPNPNVFMSKMQILKNTIIYIDAIEELLKKNGIPLTNIA